MLRPTIHTLALAALLALGSCYDNPTVIPDKTPAQAWSETPFETYTKERVMPGDDTPTVMTIDLYERGTGEPAAKLDSIAVHYTGWIKNTELIFDSSRNRPSPLQFRLGRGEVIPGWDLGLEGMTAGTRARLHIPSKLAYGEAGAGGGAIPANANLVFDVELVLVR